MLLKRGKSLDALQNESSSPSVSVEVCSGKESQEPLRAKQIINIGLSRASKQFDKFREKLEELNFL
jgi:hypothetical protein